MAGFAISSGNCFGFTALRTVADRRTNKPTSSPSPSPQLGFLYSQLSGLKISSQSSTKLSTTVVASPFRPIIARRVCPFTGKKSNKANKVSFSNHKTKKLQFVNLQYKRVWWEAGKRFVKLRLSTKALKTIEKNGLDAVAKRLELILRRNKNT